MSASRTFNFPINTLIREAKRLLGALRDTVVGPPVTGRLAAGFADGLEAQIALVEKRTTDQSGTAGTVGTLTQDQTTSYNAMVRLMAAARRSATLAFPQATTLLHSEFQVGVHDPKDLASELGRADKILAACGTHATALTATGWVAADTVALATAIKTLGGTDDEQEATKNKKKGLTATRNNAANTLYKQCQVVQNAAELAFPDNLDETEHTVVEVRARYLLETFPPRSGTSNDESETTDTDTPANTQSTPPLATTA